MGFATRLSDDSAQLRRTPVIDREKSRTRKDALRVPSAQSRIVIGLSNLTVASCFFLVCFRSLATSDGPFLLAELQTQEREVEATPPSHDGTMPFLKDGILAVIRAAIAAEQELVAASPLVAEMDSNVSASKSRSEAMDQPLADHLG
jgi:hypothetical protein